MKHITIVAASRHRPKKLEAMLRSIPRLNYLTVFIVFDRDPENYEVFKKGNDSSVGLNLLTACVDSHMGSVYCRNLAIQCTTDGVLYATDDIVFNPLTISCAFARFNSLCQDDDGVLGLSQEQDHHPTGMALVGRVFLERYPGRRLFCPYYFHFAASEVHRHAVQLDRFWYLKDFPIYHIHPEIYPNAMDDTHREARIWQRRDQDLKAFRIKHGLIWGLNG